MTSIAAGFVAGLSLIVAIGAQNAFVLRQGILRQQVAAVVGICVVSDAMLIALGATGAGTLVRAHPDVLTLLRWGGAAYLTWFAVTSVLAARRPEGLTAQRSATGASVVATALALTWLNPHVYLDTVLMLGSISAQFGEQHWLFALGAMTGSALWFPFLAVLGRRLADRLARPRTWQVVNAVIGALMICLAGFLVVGAS